MYIVIHFEILSTVILGNIQIPKDLFQMTFIIYMDIQIRELENIMMAY